MHPFEKTLGPGPYKFVGAAQIPNSALGEKNSFAYENAMKSLPRVERGMGTCAHCSHAIMNVFVVECGDGKRYGVGCDCILKVGLDPAELAKVRRAHLDHERQLRQSRKIAAKASAKAELEELIASKRNEMLRTPHPTNSLLTLLDYANWCLANVSNPKNVIKRIDEILERKNNAV